MSNGTIEYKPVVTRVEYPLSTEDTLFLIRAHADWAFSEDDEMQKAKYLFRTVFGMPTGYPVDKRPTDFWVEPDGTEKHLSMVNSTFGLLASKSAGHERKFWAMCIEKDQTLIWRTVKAFEPFDELLTQAATFDEFVASLTVVLNADEPPPPSDEDSPDTDESEEEEEDDDSRICLSYSDPGEEAQSHDDPGEEAPAVETETDEEYYEEAQSHDDSDWENDSEPGGH